MKKHRIIKYNKIFENYYMCTHIYILYVYMYKFYYSKIFMWSKDDQTML